MNVLVGKIYLGFEHSMCLHRRLDREAPVCVVAMRAKGFNTSSSLLVMRLEVVAAEGA